MKTVQKHKNRKYYDTPIRVTNEDAKKLVEILGTHKYVGKKRWKTLVRDKKGSEAIPIQRDGSPELETLGDILKRELDRRATLKAA